MQHESTNRLGLLGIHQLQQRLGLGIREFTEQVGGIVGVHRLEDVRGPFHLHVPEQVRLVVGGQFLHHVGQPFVIEGRRDLLATFRRQFPECVGDVRSPHAVELRQDLGDALTGQRQRALGEPEYVIPFHDMGFPASTEPRPRTANRDPGDHPVACAATFDRQIDHREVMTTQVLEIRIINLHTRFHDLAENQRLAGAQNEAPQTDRSGVERHRCRLDCRDAQHRNEDAPTGGQFHRQAQNPGLAGSESDRHHHISDTADGFTIGAEYRQTGQPGHERLAHRCHGCKGSGREPRSTTKESHAS